MSELYSNEQAATVRQHLDAMPAENRAKAVERLASYDADKRSREEQRLFSSFDSPESMDDTGGWYAEAERIRPGEGVKMRKKDAVAGFYAQRYGATTEAVLQDFDRFNYDYGASAHNEAVPLEPERMFERIKPEIAKAKDKRDLHTELVTAAYNEAVLGGDGGYSAWLKQAQTRPGWSEEMGYSSSLNWNKVQRSVKQSMGPDAPLLRSMAASLREQAGVDQSNEEDAQYWQHPERRLTELKVRNPEGYKVAKEWLEKIAELGAHDDGKGNAQRMAESLGRGVSGFFDRALGGTIRTSSELIAKPLAEAFSTPGHIEAIAYESASADVFQDLRAIRNGITDPTRRKEDNWAQIMVFGGADSLPSMLAVLNPVTLALSKEAYADDAYSVARKAGWEGKSAVAASLIAGETMGRIEQASQYASKLLPATKGAADWLVKALPGNLAGKIASLAPGTISKVAGKADDIVGAAARMAPKSFLGKAALNMPAQGGTEWLEELAQDNTMQFIQRSLAAVGAAPERQGSFLGEAREWIAEAGFETALVVAPLAMIGGGIAAHHQMNADAVNAITADKGKLSAVIGDTEATRVASIADPRERLEEFQAAYNQAGKEQRIAHLKDYSEFQGELRQFQQGIAEAETRDAASYGVAARYNGKAWFVTLGDGSSVQVDSAEAAARIRSDLLLVATEREADEMISQVETWANERADIRREATLTGDLIERKGGVMQATDARGKVRPITSGGLLESVRQQTEGMGQDALNITINGSNAVFAENVAQSAADLVQVITVNRGRNQSAAFTFLHERVEANVKAARFSSIVSAAEVQTALAVVAKALPIEAARTRLESLRQRGAHQDHIGEAEGELALRERLHKVTAGQGNEVEMREVAVELAVAEVLGRDKRGGRTGLPAGALNKMLSEAAMSATTAEEVKALGKFRAFLRSVRAWLRGVLGTVAGIEKGRRDGKLKDGDDFSALVDTMLGLEGSKFAKAVESEASAMMGESSHSLGDGKIDGETFSLSASRLREAMPKRDAVGTLPKVSAYDAFQWWETNMVGRTIETPIGLSFTAKPGHFFRFVAHKLEGEQKGFIDGYETAAEAQAALRNGAVDSDEISGWEQFRAEHLPQAPDLLAKPDLVLAEVKDGKVSLHFVKRYGGNMLFVGYGIQGGKLAPLSFGPRTIKPKDLAGMHLLHAGQEVMEGMQNSLPALPPVSAGSWQAQDPADWAVQYPLVDLDVNLSHSLSPTRRTELVENRLAVVLNQDSEKARQFAGRANDRLAKQLLRYAGVPAAKSKAELDAQQRGIVESRRAELEDMLTGDIEHRMGGVNALPQSFYDHPLFDAFFKRRGRQVFGRLTPPGKWRAEQVAKLNIGEIESIPGHYDSAQDLPRWVFRGGNGEPNEQAQELYENGTIDEPTPDALWSKLGSLLDEVSANKAQARSYREQLKEAREQAKSEAEYEGRAWRFEEEAAQDFLRDPREAARRDIAALEAVTMAMPAEARAKLPRGLSAMVVGAKSDKAFAEAMTRAVLEVDKALQSYWKAKNIESMNELVMLGQGKSSPGKKPRGTATPEVHRYFGLVNQVVNSTPMELAAMKVGLMEQLEDLKDDAHDAELDIMQRVNVIDAWGGFETMNVAAQDRLLAMGWETYRAGRNAWWASEEARLLKQRENSQAVIETLGGGTLGALTRKRARQSFIKDWSREYVDFGQFLNRLLGNHELAKGWEANITKAFTAKEVALGHLRKRWESALAVAMPTLSKHQRERRFYELHTKRSIKVELSEEALNALLNRSAREAMAEMNLKPDRVTDTAELTEAEALTLLLTWDQPKYRASLIKSGVDAAVVMKIKEAVSPEAISLMGWMRGQLKDQHPKLNAVFQRVAGIDLPSLPNYWPGRFYNAGTVEEKIDVMGQGVVGQGFADGFLKDRKNHESFVKLEDAFVTFWRHMNQSAHWQHLAEPVREMRGVMRNPQVKKAIEAGAGEQFLVDASSWLDVLEANGTRAAHAGVEEKVFAKLLGNFSIGRLAWNPFSIIRQAPAMFNVGFDSGLTPGMLIQGAGSIISDPSRFGDIYEELYASDEVFARVEGGMGPEVRNALNSFWKSGPGMWRQAMDKGMENLGFADAMFTTIGGVVAYESKAIELEQAGLPPAAAHAQAIEAARLAIVNTAQPNTVNKRSLRENSTTSVIAKSVAMFMSDPRQKFAFYQESIMDVIANGKDASRESWNRLIWTWCVVGPASQMLASAIRDALDGDDDGEWLNPFSWLDAKNWTVTDFAISSLLGPLRGLFFAGQMVEALANKIAGRSSYSSSGTVADVPKDVGSDLLRAGGYLTDDKDQSNAAYGKLTLDLMSDMGGAPAMVAGTIRKALKITGE